jgi:hypothetical protein
MDREISAQELDDISECFAFVVRQADAGDRIVLTLDQAQVLRDCLDELDDPIEAAAGSRKPTFFAVGEECYFNIASIAMVIRKPNGDVALLTVNNSVINIEALQWQMMKEQFHSAIDLRTIKTTGGLVAGNGDFRQ